MSSTHKALESGTEKNKDKILFIPTITVVTASVPRIAMLQQRLVLDFPNRQINREPLCDESVASTGSQESVFAVRKGGRAWERQECGFHRRPEEIHAAISPHLQERTVVIPHTFPFSVYCHRTA